MPSPATARSWRFHGQIAGWGTARGARFVLGVWHDSPLGGFADVMVEHPDGERVLLAPSPEVAAFVGSTYRFDDVVITPVTVRSTGRSLRLDAGPLTAQLTSGRRTVLGWALRPLPRRVATAPAFSYLTDPVARLLLRGIRTRGSAGGGRTEHYGATDVRRLVTATTRWEEQDLGVLRDLDPPVRFGFGSAPRRPSITTLVTTVRRPARSSGTGARSS